MLAMVQVVGGDSIADHVVISEIIPDPAGTDEGHEWVELYNPTDESIVISGWKGGSTSFLNQFTIPEGTSIASHRFYLIGESEVSNKDFEAALTITNSGGNANFILKDESGTVIDRVGWDTSTVYETSPCSKPGSGKSLQRKVNDTITQNGYGPGWDSNDNSADFFIQDSPNPQNRGADPLPPVPELPSIILFSIGLIALTGYVLLTKKRN